MLAFDFYESVWRGAVLAAALLLVGIFILRSRQQRRAAALAPDTDLQTLIYAYPEAALRWFESHPCWLLHGDERQPDRDYLGPFLVQRRGEPIDLRVYGVLPDCESSIDAFRASLIQAVGTEPGR